MKAQLCYLSSSLLLFALLSVLGIRAVQAQSITPGSDTHTVISNPGSNPNQFDISGGTRAGNNLFHSFQQFGLSQGQTANFLSHPTIQNILGRVTGGNASMINGLIQVTGGNSNLFLMNPSGIIFGPNARLNIPASFMATTANGIRMGNGWFNATGFNNYANLSGNPDSFAFLGNPGAILNAGVLTTNPGQNITLLGGVVVNTGTISAPGGTITIVAIPGQRLVKITQEGSLLSLVLPTEEATAINPPANTPLSLPALLTGGTIPEATGITVENGVVKLTSNSQAIPTEVGAATVSGSLSTASTTLPNASQIEVLGDRVSLLNANLNASGLNGSVVRIGGDYRGAGTLPNARFTEVDANTTIRADALSSLGNGGNVVAWSTDTTRFDGTITAQGGSNGGNGGFVETSGKQTLIVSPSASVSTRASQGQAGTWLLDPPELTIGAMGTATLAGAPPLTNTPTSATTISATAIVSGLNGSHVHLQAENLITVNEIIDASGNTSVGNLTFTTPTATLNQPIILTAGSTLSGTASSVNVNAGGRIQNGVDVAAAWATVNVAAGTFYVPGVVNQVSIMKPLTVRGAGAGNTIIDGGGNSRGVYVNPGGRNTANLDGLTVRNGLVYGDGAGILVSSGTVNLTNSAIDSNSASPDFSAQLIYGRGGGIFNDWNSTINVTNSTISNNSIGGIYNNGGTVNLISSTVSNSSGNGIANINGIINLNNSAVNSSSRFFYTNGYIYITNDGGGIFNNDGGTVNLTNSNISNNSGLMGGGIDNWGGTVNLVNTVVTGNSAGNVGGILNLQGIINLSESSVTGNLGGAGGISNFNGQLIVINSNITGNLANGEGGGIHNDAYNVGSSVNITNSNISNNLSKAQGGGIYNNGGSIKLIGSHVLGNLANDGGGGIYNTGHTWYSIYNELAILNGTVNVINSNISGNLASGNGGGIYNYGESTDSARSFKANNNITINNSIISNNMSLNGGGIYNSKGTINLTNSSLSGNRAGNGGGIYNTEGTVNLTNTSLTSNSANYGGSIWNGGYDLYIHETYVYYPSYSRADFSRYLPSDDSIVNLTSSTLGGNTANLDGGAIFNNGGTVNLTNSTLSRNIAIQDGGAIYNDLGYMNYFTWQRIIFFTEQIRRSGTVNLTNSTLSGNVANRNGGGIYNFSSKDTVNLTNSTLSGNSATSGGGIYNAGTLQIRNSIIAGNIAFSGRELINLSKSTSEGYNLFGFNGSSGIEGMVLSATDIVPSVALRRIITPLGNYGGPTQTHALMPGSPAIDAGDPSLFTPDQRGFSRVGRADIGAFEYRVDPLTLFTLANLNQITNALFLREVEPMVVEFEPIPSSPILCVDRNQDRVEQEPDVYQGIPACAQ